MQSPDRNQPDHHSATPRNEGLRRYSVAHFLIALVVLLLGMPFVAELEHGRLIESAIFTVVLLSGVAAVGGRRRTLIIAALLLAPAAITRWVDHFQPGPTPRVFTILAITAFLIFVLLNLFRFILHAPHVNSEVVCAGISGYLVLGILWAMAFLLVARTYPGSFAFSGGAAGETLDGYNAIYLSFGSLSTLGFTEVVPISRQARMMAVFEALSGMFYVATLISRLVALYSRRATGDIHE